MSDLKHLTHDEGHALAAFRAGLNCDEEVEQVFKALAELRARHEKLVAGLRNIPRHVLDVETTPKGKATGVFLTPDQKGDVVFASDVDALLEDE